jgi:hypothetical protein
MVTSSPILGRAAPVPAAGSRLLRNSDEGDGRRRFVRLDQAKNAAQDADVVVLMAGLGSARMTRITV